MLLITGDASSKLKELPADSVDLTVTSPPYDGLRKYNGYSFDFETIARELYRVTKLGGVVVWIVGDSTDETESGTSFRQALFFKECGPKKSNGSPTGFNLHDTMIYASEKPPLTHNRYEQKFEYMFVFSKGKPKTFNPIMEPCVQAGKVYAASSRTFRHTDDGVLGKANKPGAVKDYKIKGNIWTYLTGRAAASDEFAYKHPATFPEKLAEDHILSWSNPGDAVLDPMMGSGTTGKMAVKNGREFIGIDISAEYTELARNRILLGRSIADGSMTTVVETTVDFQQKTGETVSLKAVSEKVVVFKSLPAGDKRTQARIILETLQPEGAMSESKLIAALEGKIEHKNKLGMRDVWKTIRPKLVEHGYLEIR